MATNQAQGKLSVDLNEARTDVTCHIDCLQLERLCLFYTPSFTVLHFLPLLLNSLFLPFLLHPSTCQFVHNSLACKGFL